MRPQMQIGQVILDRRLGEGGMAEVWLGHNAVLGTPVAVKFLISPWAGHPELEERFLREAKRQGALDHPNIVKVYGFEYVEDHSFLIMQFIDGESLDDRLVRFGRKPLDFGDVLRIASGALQGLGYAHDRQIVHRDIKPSNIMLDRNLHAYIGDFGLVMVRDEKRMTRTGTLMGTPLYMSPEQIVRPKEVDHRADIYSFGCVLYEMFTGRTPFESADSDTDFHVKMAHTTQPPPALRQFNPGVPPEVEAVVMRCLEKDRERRFQTCGELREALAQAMTAAMPALVAEAAAAGPPPAPVVFPFEEPRVQMPSPARPPTQAEVFPWNAAQVSAPPAAFVPPPPPPGMIAPTPSQFSATLTPLVVPAPPRRSAWNRILHTPAALAGLSALAVASLAGASYLVVKHNPFGTSGSDLVNPTPKSPKRAEAGPESEPMPQPGPEGGAHSVPVVNPTTRPAPNVNPGPRTTSTPTPNPSGNAPMPQPKADATPGPTPNGNPIPVVNPKQAAYNAPLNRTKFRVRLTNGISSEASEQGEPIRAAVVSPAAYSACSMDGVVTKAGRSGFIPGMRKAELLFTFHTLRCPNGSSRAIESKVVSISNSRGQVGIDEEGQKVQSNDAAKKIFLATAGGAVIGAITGHSKGAAAKGAVAGAGVGVMLTSLSGKGKVMTFAPGSTLALQVSDRQDHRP